MSLISLLLLIKHFDCERERQAIDERAGRMRDRGWPDDLTNADRALVDIIARAQAEIRALHSGRALRSDDRP